MIKTRWRSALALLLVLLAGCSPVRNDGTVDLTKSKTVMIEGCEYIVFETSCQLCNNYSFAITHKGNCSNPSHRRMN
jgi:hypothetical protein